MEQLIVEASYLGLEDLKQCHFGEGKKKKDTQEEIALLPSRRTPWVLQTLLQPSQKFAPPKQNR